MTGIIHDFSTKQGTIEAIKWECKDKGLTLNSQIAYVLATVEHETANTFKPVVEAYWLSEDWRRKNLRYYPFYGRGFVQLTWRENYRKYGRILGINLENNPDLACNPNVALFVLVHGFRTGGFTGRKLTEYVNQDKKDYFNARRCINGTDKASLIAKLAKDWEVKL